MRLSLIIKFFLVLSTLPFSVLSVKLSKIRDKKAFGNNILCFDCCAQ